MQAGDVVRVDFPGHVAHGQRVRVVEIIHDFDVAHPDAAWPAPRTSIFVQAPSWPEPCSLPPERLSGTIENAQLRMIEAPNDEKQGALLL